MIFTLLPLIFLLGIVAIALEDVIKVNKTAIALFMCVALWGILMIDAQAISADNGQTAAIIAAGQEPSKASADLFIRNSLQEHLGNVCETLFFVMCSMLLINIVDKHGGFEAVTRYVRTNNKRSLLWFFCISSFFFSALLDNLAAAIVLIAILGKLVPDKTDRLKYACMIIISCNAGGSWSPIGDVTTLLLWTNGRISVAHQVLHLFVPALINMLLPLIVAHFFLFKSKVTLRETRSIIESDDYFRLIPATHRRFIFWLGILSLILIPVYQIAFGIPPFIGILIGVVVLWLYTDLMYKNLHTIQEQEKLSIVRLLPDVDLTTILYFLGILMAVGALETSGVLASFGKDLSALTSNTSLISFMIGLISSLVDNVALVAAVMGMYDISSIAGSPFVADGSFWTFLSYCAVTGGSLLIIGSATGVTVMGLEKISFGYYLKRFSLLALLGYIGGAATYLLLFLK